MGHNAWEREFLKQTMEAEVRANWGRKGHAVWASVFYFTVFHTLRMTLATTSKCSREDWVVFLALLSKEKQFRFPPSRKVSGSCPALPRWGPPISIPQKPLSVPEPWTSVFENKALFGLESCTLNSPKCYQTHSNHKENCLYKELGAVGVLFCILASQ